MPPVKVDPTAIPEELRLRVLAAIAKELEIDSAAAAQRRAQERGSGPVLDDFALAGGPAQHPDVVAVPPPGRPGDDVWGAAAGPAHDGTADGMVAPDQRSVGEQDTAGETGGQEEAAAWPPMPLPRRASEVNGAPQPPAPFRRGYLPPSLLGRRLDSEDLTEPLPRITDAHPGDQPDAADVWTRTVPVADQAAVTPPPPAPVEPPEPAAELMSAAPPPTPQAQVTAPAGAPVPGAPAGPAEWPSTGPFPPAPPPDPWPAGPDEAPPGGTGGTSSAPPAAEALPLVPAQAAKPRVAAATPQAVPRPRRSGRPYRIAGLFLAVAALAIAGLAGLMLSGRTPAARHHAGTGPAGSGAAVAARDRAVAWVTGQVSRTTVVACDPATCRALRSHGVPARGLYQLGPGTSSPLPAQIVVATAAVRARFGSRLATVYAPAVLASFGTGQDRVDIRATAPHGAAAYRALLSADMASRQAAGTQLLHSKGVTAAPAARQQLAAGQVDARLLLVITEMSAAHPMYIVDFGTPAPGAAAGIPLRQMDVAETTHVRGHPGHTVSAGYVRSMISFLHAQQGRYRPLSVRTVHLAGGLAALRIVLPAPSPLGLLGPHA